MEEITKSMDDFRIFVWIMLSLFCIAYGQSKENYEMGYIIHRKGIERKIVQSTLKNDFPIESKCSTDDKITHSRCIRL